MRKIIVPTAIIVSLFLLTLVSCKKKEKVTPIQDNIETSFDSTLVKSFFVKHPLLKNYQADVEQLYRKHQYHYVWYDKSGINEFGNVLYNKINALKEEGIQNVVPYLEQLDLVYDDMEDNHKPNADTELLHSALYFYYTKTVYNGLDVEKSKEMEWYLPRKKQSYVNYLDSLLIDPSLINKDEKGVLSQYFLLKEVLLKYRQMEKKGGWKSIALDPKFKSYKVGDSSTTIAQIRQRLFLSNDIATDSKSAIYDKTLATGILKYNKRIGNAASTVILPELIKDLNVPVTERIKTLIVNMERCRWLSNDVTKTKELIAINIPAYELTYFRNGKPELRSDVVVGKVMNKTVVFSAPMKYIVFSPYWNIPESILQKEVLPGIEKNPNYLEEHDMEWNKENVRQKPGPKNSLGLIKFLFPNSNAIYLHDTPAKSLFNKEDRAFSHGCIRVAKPIDLAVHILKNDKDWNREKIEAAMNSGEETWYTLKNKIPVYIGYFTAWVDTEGTIHFYQDVYDRDAALAALLFIK
jgi:murein L,D-transpeptidase YcbB/YkuD